MTLPTNGQYRGCICHSVKLYDDLDIEPARERVKETDDFPPLSRVAQPPRGLVHCAVRNTPKSVFSIPK